MTAFIAPFNAQHVWLVTDRRDLRAMADKLEALGPAWSLVDDGEVLACAGLGMMWPGAAEGWAIVRPGLTARQRLQVARAFLAGVPRRMADAGLRRLQASVIADNDLGVRLARRLGMDEEGRMRRYGPGGEDHLRFALVAA